MATHEEIEAAKTLAVATLRELENSDDAEEAHGTADTVLLTLLRTMGAGEVSDAFIETRDKRGFWYS